MGTIKHLGATAFVTAVLTLTTSGATVAEGQIRASNVESKWQVDMRGRPPYKRERVAVERVDVAAMEVMSIDTATEVVWVREHTGRPPFKRERVELPVVDVASMEVMSKEERKTSFRGRPSFKRHR